MNQLVKYTESEIQELNEDGNTWFTSMLDVKKKNNHILGAAMPEKELKIRRQLEMEVERDLEQEIKDGICNLSLRLHHLYQRQKERQVKEASSEDNTTRKSLSEVNISIKMDGKTKVAEIKEIKKEARTGKEKGHRRSWSQRSEDMKQVSGLNNGKKVDWEKTLRGGSSGTVSVKKTNGRSSNRDSSGRVKRQGNNKVNHKILQL